MDRHAFITAFNHCRLVENEHDFPSLFETFPTPRNAAVMILLVEREDGLHVLFTRRAEHLKHHAGQISFPGGKYETFDDSLQDTAIRETEEEIGITITHDQVLGSIGQYATISGFNVTPYIAIADSIPPLTIDKNEVDYAFEVPLAHCINPQNLLSHRVTRLNKTFPVYFIPWRDTYIWGATAGMLKQLSHHLSA